ncbi:hypothetical protein ACTFIW_003309 [Dictyostelium discoideum]
MAVREEKESLYDENWGIQINGCYLSPLINSIDPNRSKKIFSYITDIDQIGVISLFLRLFNTYSKSNNSFNVETIFQKRGVLDLLNFPKVCIFIQNSFYLNHIV